jgi:hypothetical protein
MTSYIESKTAALFTFLFLFSIAAVPVAGAQGQSASHGLTIDVQQIDELSVSGSPEVTISELGTWTEMAAQVT